ncbi:galactose mutarotase-like [Schistocerca serialis cubense]|uniref:galactose mutarotase-like n=1 Tax=Schistocerca serialis cubense TaxID=2023355 RepID=UPI00214F087D|nr:galactose mutarotase-like [Schistocerca serialis cubense]
MVGRVAGRVPYARFSLANAIFNLTENVETDGPVRHHQDGGFHGLQHLRWNSHVPCEGSSLVLSVVHHDEQEGFPGAVLVQLLFQVTKDHRLVIHARADSTKPSLINLRQGIMFNLAGHDAGQPDFMDHILTLNADEYVVQTRRGTPTGEIRLVSKTALDFRAPNRMRKQHGRTTAGYDHLLCLNHLPPDGLNMVARLEHPETGRALEVRTNQPCMHVYTGRRLPPWRPPKPRPPTPPTEDVEEEETTETDPASAAKTKSQDRFPKCVVTPVKTYEHVTVYRFYAKPKPPRYSLAEDVVRTSVETAIQEVETREAEPPPEQ